MRVQFFLHASHHLEVFGCSFETKTKKKNYPSIHPSLTVEIKMDHCGKFDQLKNEDRT